MVKVSHHQKYGMEPRPEAAAAEQAERWRQAAFACKYLVSRNELAE
jgi:hypothetical protein